IQNNSANWRTTDWHGHANAPALLCPGHRPHSSYGVSQWAGPYSSHGDTLYPMSAGSIPNGRSRRTHALHGPPPYIHQHPPTRKAASIPEPSVYLPGALPCGGYAAHRTYHQIHGKWDATVARYDVQRYRTSSYPVHTSALHNDDRALPAPPSRCRA